MKIESNIPIPCSRHSFRKVAVFRDMKPGDSVVIPTVEANAWRAVAYNHKIKITIRKISETETRLWRV